MSHATDCAPDVLRHETQWQTIDARGSPATLYLTLPQKHPPSWGPPVIISPTLFGTSDHSSSASRSRVCWHCYTLRGKLPRGGKVVDIEGGPVRAVLCRPDQPRGRRKRGARTEEAWGGGDLPRRPDLLRSTRFQLRLLRRGPRRRAPLPRRLRGGTLRLRSLSVRILHHHGLPLLPLHLQGPAGRARAFRGSRRSASGSSRTSWST